ncbi:hypothetical protein MKW92_050235, partial [Papaver armeniacum]
GRVLLTISSSSRVIISRIQIQGLCIVGINNRVSPGVKESVRICRAAGIGYRRQRNHCKANCKG